MPLHIVGAEGVIANVGPGRIVTVTLPLAWQPLASVPVTVYTVVAVGFTVGLYTAEIVAVGDALHE